MGAHIGRARSYVPAEIDMSEPECVVWYRWEPGLAATHLSPEEPPETEIIQVLMGGIDIWPVLQGLECCEEVWRGAVEDNLREWMEGVGDEGACDDV